jgi:hypothetical protein
MAKTIEELDEQIAKKRKEQEALEAERLVILQTNAAPRIEDAFGNLEALVKAGICRNQIAKRLKRLLGVISGSVRVGGAKGEEMGDVTMKKELCDFDFEKANRYARSVDTFTKSDVVRSLGLDPAKQDLKPVRWNEFKSQFGVVVAGDREKGPNLVFKCKKRS